jgi:uncharacterized membrane protein HdeD (DUF308 family)
MISGRSTWLGAFRTPIVDAETGARLQRPWRVLLLFGALQLAAGVLAMVMPQLASVAAAVFVGAVLVLLSIFQIANGISDRGLPGYGLRILSGILYLGVGVVMVLYPRLGVLTLIVLVAVAFIVEGALRAVMAAWLRPVEHWWLQLVGGVLGFAIGVMLLAGWPVTGFRALGILLGANLMLSGSIYCALSLHARAAARDAARGNSEVDAR